MKSIMLTHIIDDIEQEKKLNELARRCEKISGWTEQDILQFAISAMPMKNYFTAWIMFAEDVIIDYEQVKKNKPLWKKILHTDSNIITKDASK